MKKTIFFVLSILFVGTSVFAQKNQSITKEGHINQNKFRQLKQELPTPNSQHTASGAPGKNYTQQKRDTSLEVMKKYFYAFWVKRSELEPEKKWEEYWQNVIAVDEVFGTRIRKGYNTDRGRIYLKYGKPNSRMEVPNEPNSYPYEVWHYFQINNQTNGRFVFWSNDNVTNDYELLHSTIFTEANNPRWEMMLQQRNTSMHDLDQLDPGYTRGGRAREYWDNPR